MTNKSFDPVRNADADAIRLARSLVRCARFGALAVLDPASGAPMVSRVGLATATDGVPLILVSALAAHTAALHNDARCSLLVGEPAKGDSLAHPRITIACRARQLERPTAEHEAASARYLARNPKAGLYAGFADFAFFRLEPQSASLNGGFGKAYRLTADDLRCDPSASSAIEVAQAEILGRLSEADLGEFSLKASAALGKTVSAASPTGIDPDGIDINHRDGVARIWFETPVTNAESALTEASRIFL